MSSPEYNGGTIALQVCSPFYYLVTRIRGKGCSFTIRQNSNILLTGFTQAQRYQLPGALQDPSWFWSIESFSTLHVITQTPKFSSSSKLSAFSASSPKVVRSHIHLNQKNLKLIEHPHQFHNFRRNILIILIRFFGYTISR